MSEITGHGDMGWLPSQRRCQKCSAWIKTTGGDCQACGARYPDSWMFPTELEAWLNPQRRAERELEALAKAAAEKFQPGLPGVPTADDNERVLDDRDCFEQGFLAGWKAAQLGQKVDEGCPRCGDPVGLAHKRMERGDPWTGDGDVFWICEHGG